MRGNELQRRFESVESQANSTYTVAQNELREASGVVDRLFNEQVRTVANIASTVLAAEGKGLFSGIEARRSSRLLQAELEQRDKQRREIKSRLAEQRSVVSGVEQEVQVAAQALHEKEHALEELQREAIHELKKDPRTAAQFERAEALADQLDKSEQKAIKAQQDADKKAPPFENNPLFAYLLKRQYGTPNYRANNFIAMLDAWVARKVNFAKQFPDYQTLKKIPGMVQDHTSHLREEYNELQAHVAAARANALREWPGMAEAEKAVRVAQSALEKIKSKLQDALSRMENLDDALTQFAQGTDPHTRRALDMVTQLINTDTGEAEALVRSTASTEDDRALARLKVLRAELVDARERVEALKRKQVEARTHLDRVQEFVRRFRDSSLGRSNKRYSDTKPETWIAALATGAALEQLFSQVKSNARTVDDTPSHSSSSSGSFEGGFGGSSSSGGSSGFGTSSGFGGGGYSTTGSIGGGGYKTTGGF